MKHLLIAIAMLFATSVFSSALYAQDSTCKVFDANGDEIWSGPCDRYRDSCLTSSPPNCPTVRCSGGVVGEIKNGDRCLPGTAKQYNGDDPVESIEICYCDVPIGALANPLLWLIGILFGFRMFRSKLV